MQQNLTKPKSEFNDPEPEDWEGCQQCKTGMRVTTNTFPWEEYFIPVLLK